VCSAAKPQEILQKAEKKEARQLTDVERKRIREREEATFRELRLFLRDVINKLGKDRKFAMFAKPVNITEVIMCVLNEWMMFLLTCDKKLTKSQLSPAMLLSKPKQQGEGQAQRNQCQDL